MMCHPHKRSGFTLIEILVATAVLSIIILALATIIGVVTRVWVSGIGSADNLTNARNTLGLLDRDIQLMVLRRDLAAFVDGSGNFACDFYTNVQGNPGADTRTVSLVQYILTTSPTPSLYRYNYGMSFSGPTPLVGTTTSLSVPNNFTQQTDILNGIIQFQIQFEDGTGTILNPPYILTSTPPTSSSPPASVIPPSKTPFWFDYANPGASYNPRKVVVSMVVLSNSAYTLATQTGKMATIAGSFSSAQPTNQTYSQVWNGFLASPSAGFLALPEPIRAGVQVFGRDIPLPLTPP